MESQEVTAPEGSEEKVSRREVSGEALVARIFREVSITALVEAGRLEGVRDTFVHVINNHPSAKKTDKSYATRYADDMTAALLARAPAKEVPVALIEAPVVAPGELSQEDLATLLGNLDEDEDAYTSMLGTGPSFGDRLREGPLRAIMDEFKSRHEHPFLRTFMFEGQRYVALGTLMGVLPNGPHAGKSINAHMTINPYRRFRDVPDTVAVVEDGRQVSLDETVNTSPAGDLRKFLFVVRHQPGLKIRWWLRLDNRDQPQGVRHVVLDVSQDGWHQARLATHQEGPGLRSGPLPFKPPALSLSMSRRTHMKSSEYSLGAPVSARASGSSRRSSSVYFADSSSRSAAVNDRGSRGLTKTARSSAGSRCTPHGPGGPGSPPGSAATASSRRGSASPPSSEGRPGFPPRRSSAGVLGGRG